MARLIKLQTNQLAQRILCVLVLVAVCAASLPVPVPVVASLYKDRSIPFPCQDHPCGCRNALQCWTSCGCMSMAEKLNWAEARGITPPSFVDAKANTKSACCSSKTKSCCSKAPSTGGGACERCSQKKQPAPTLTAVTEQKPQRIVLLTSYIAKCGGQDSMIASLPWSIIPKPLAIASASRLCVWRWVHVDDHTLSAQAEPPIPPPRLLQFA
jgi:hypothetical protein